MPGTAPLLSLVRPGYASSSHASSHSTQLCAQAGDRKERRTGQKGDAHERHSFFLRLQPMHPAGRCAWPAQGEGRGAIDKKQACVVCTHASDRQNSVWPEAGMTKEFMVRS